MAFCTKCGKQLADGEVCSCTQPVQQPIQMQASQVVAQPAYNKVKGENPFSTVWKTLIGLFKAPYETIQEYVEKGSVACSLVIAGFFLISASVFGVIFKIINSAISYNGLGARYGYDVFYYVRVFFNEVFGNAAAIALMAVVFMLLVKAMGKGNASYLQSLSAISLSYIIPIASTFLIDLFSMLNISFFYSLASWVSQFVGVLGMIYVAIAVAGRVEKKAMMPLIVACIYFAGAFAQYIFNLMFFL